MGREKLNLPKEYQDKVKQLLEEEYEQYTQCLKEVPKKGLRVNTLKISPEEFEKISPFLLKKIPWTTNGYYFSIKEQPAKHPYYFAGLYYIQEPCAMAPAEFMPVEPGDKVLDLCAAPGGKSTELAAKLKGKGVLVSNDISSSRAKALLKNIELLGVKNSFVMSEAPERLKTKFAHYFDKILIDAPCSGEGMFRKDPGSIKVWNPERVSTFVNLQKKIVTEAIEMLKPGGKLLYSTCTFSPEENEGVIQYILDHFSDFTVEKIDIDFQGRSQGRPEWIKNGSEQLKKCIRLWPHKVDGEGHFVALLSRKKEETLEENKIVEITSDISMQDDRLQHKRKKKSQKDKKEVSSKKLDSKKNLVEAECFFDTNFHRFSLDFWQELCQNYKDRLFVLPEEMIDLSGLHILRSGLFLGENKKKRFEPSQALAMTLKKEEVKNVVDLSLADENVKKYLKGETIEVDSHVNGWVLICVDGYPLGWGKANQGVIKNKYLSSWRLL